MKFNQKALIIVVALFMLGCSANNKSERQLETISVDLARQSEANGYGVISTKELVEMKAGSTPFILVDVRKWDDFSRGHIPGALNFTFPKSEEMSGSWSSTLMGGRSEQDFVRLLGGNYEQVLIFTCGRTSCIRGHNAAMWAKRLGYSNVLRHPGGFDAWRETDMQIVVED